MKDFNMMKLQKFSLAFVMAISVQAIYADTTDDLLFAIEKGDVSQVTRAIKEGADLDISREEDGHNARSLAIAKFIESLETNQQSGTVASIMALGIPLAAAINSWQYTLAAAATAFAGYKLHVGESKGFLDKLRNVGTGKYMIIGSLLGTLGLAWNSSSPYTLASSAIGTAGLAALYYKSNQIRKRYEIYSLVNPDDQFLQESVQ